MHEGISNPEFYGDLVYTFEKIIRNPNVLLTVSREQGILWTFCGSIHAYFFNPIMTEGYAALFSCTAVVRVSDSMTASMWSI